MPCATAESSDTHTQTCQMICAEACALALRGLTSLASVLPALQPALPCETSSQPMPDCMKFPTDSSLLAILTCLACASEKLSQHIAQGWPDGRRAADVRENSTVGVELCLGSNCCCNDARAKGHQLAVMFGKHGRLLWQKLPQTQKDVLWPQVNWGLLCDGALQAMFATAGHGSVNSHEPAWQPQQR